MSNKYVRKYTVSGGDMDVNYHMTKVAIAKYFQETFAMFCAKHNLAAFDVCEQNLAWVIAYLHINFPSNMPYWSEEFEVHIWISEKTKLRTYCDFEVYCKDILIAKGDSCWYLLDITSRRPVKSIDVLEAFQTYEQKVFSAEEKQPFNFDGELICSKTHKVTVRDLDFNHHANNLSYIGLAIETIFPEYFEEYNVDAYTAKFVQEVYLDDELCCDIFKTGNNMTAKIYKTSDNTDVCYLVCECSERTDFSRDPRENKAVFA